MKYPINNYVVEDDVDRSVQQYFHLLTTPVDLQKKKKKKTDEDKLLQEYCFQDDE